jgi:hypothetical protein
MFIKLRKCDGWDVGKESEKTNAYEVLVANAERNRWLGRYKLRREDNIKITLNK